MARNSGATAPQTTAPADIVTLPLGQVRGVATALHDIEACLSQLRKAHRTGRLYGLDPVKLLSIVIELRFKGAPYTAADVARIYGERIVMKTQRPKPPTTLEGDARQLDLIDVLTDLSRVDAEPSQPDEAADLGAGPNGGDHAL